MTEYKTTKLLSSLSGVSLILIGLTSPSMAQENSRLEVVEVGVDDLEDAVFIESDPEQEPLRLDAVESRINRTDGSTLSPIYIDGETVDAEIFGPPDPETQIELYDSPVFQQPYDELGVDIIEINLEPN